MYYVRIMINRKQGLVITGGAAADSRWFHCLSGNFEVIVAADSGLETAAKLGVDVDMVVGDMDSLTRVELLESVPPERFRRYDEEKDDTDTQIGLGYLREAGCGYLGIYGGGGGRLDHLIAILSLFDRSDPPDIWVTDSNVVILIEKELSLYGMKNQVVSFFPAGSERCTMISKGLKWSLDHLLWVKGDVGVSNVITTDEMRVEMLSGRLLFVGPLDTLIGLRP